MVTALMEAPMNAEKPKTSSVKLQLDVVESARIVSAYRGETITDMLSDLLRPVLAKMEQEETSESRRQATRRTASRANPKNDASCRRRGTEGAGALSLGETRIVRKNAAGACLENCFIEGKKGVVPRCKS